MVRTKKIYGDKLLKGGYDFVVKNGFDKFTARRVMNYIGYSTQPLYHEFGSLDNYKETLLNYIVVHISATILEQCPTDSYSLTEAVCQFSSTAPEEFIRLFLQDSTCKSRLKDDVYIHFKKTLTSKKSADSEILFDNFWYYTLGKAADIAYSR